MGGKGEGEKGGKGEREKVRWSVIGLAFFQAIGMWTHNTFAVFFPLALLIGIGLSAFRAQSGHPPHSALKAGTQRKLIYAQLLAFLLWSPWLVNFVRQAIKVDQEFWIRPPGLSQITDLFRRLLFDHFTGESVIGLGIALSILCALLGFGRLRRSHPQSSGILLSFWLLPFLAELLISFRRPLLHPPSLIWTSLALYLLMAIGIGWVIQQGTIQQGAIQQWQRIGRGLLFLCVAGILVIDGIGLSNYYQFMRKEQWEDVAAYVNQRATAEDLILFNATWVQLPFEYYAQRNGLQAELRGLPVDLFERGVTEPKMSNDDLPYLRQLIQGKERIWLVYSHDWYTDPGQIILRELRNQHREEASQKFEGVRIFEFLRQK